MNSDSYQFKLKTKNITILDKKKSLEYLFKKEFNIVKEFNFFKLYRVLYKQENSINPVKLIIPILKDEDDLFECVDILALPQVTRAVLFDMLLETKDFIITKNILDYFNKNIFVKKSIKKYNMNMFMNLELIEKTDLEDILFLPLLRTTIND